MKSDYLYIILGGFFVGVVFRSFVYSKIAFALSIIFLSLIFLIWRNKKAFFIIFIFIFSFGVGILRYDIKDESPLKNILDDIVGKKMIVEGIVSTDPEIKDDTLRFVIASKSNIFVRTQLYPTVKYGDLIRLEGKIMKPENFDGGSGKIFDYVSYLSKDDVYYTMSMPSVSVISHNNGNPIKNVLYKIKNSFLTQIEKIIPAPYSALEGGLLLGTKQSLGTKLQDDFRRAGIIHIVVLSGYNITIIADFIMKIMVPLPNVYGIGAGIIGIILFAIMAGGEATVVRATIMALFVILAKSSRRNYDVTRALSLAGFLMILHNPKIVVYDSSFQLSFMATLGLIYVAPIIETKLVWITKHFKIREIMTTTLATQLFVLPMLLYKMGELSLVGIPVNLLILGIIPITMLLGFITGLVSFLSIFIAWITGGLTYFLLWYQIGVVEFFSSLPFASIKISYFPFWLAVLVYVGYLIIYLRFYNSPQLHPNSN
ncbi:MAG: ComEC family competence protein [Patescibacteria group bacterium]|nr:ComEC family competence protein [Patescibacteria group bacterium]